MNLQATCHTYVHYLHIKYIHYLLIKWYKLRIYLRFFICWVIYNKWTHLSNFVEYSFDINIFDVIRIFLKEWFQPCIIVVGYETYWPNALKYSTFRISHWNYSMQNKYVPLIWFCLFSPLIALFQYPKLTAKLYIKKNMSRITVQKKYNGSQNKQNCSHCISMKCLREIMKLFTLHMRIPPGLDRAS